MNDDTALMEIESIKKLKARYCRYLDMKDWDKWRDVFTDDFVGDTTEAGGSVIVGVDEFMAYTRNTIGKPSQATVQSSARSRDRTDISDDGSEHLGTQRRRPPGADLYAARLRPLPRDLREDRRPMANQDLQTDPASRGRDGANVRPAHRRAIASRRSKDGAPLRRLKRRTVSIAVK